jgi:hypothetical protein
MARAQPSVDPLAVVTAYETARNNRDLDAALACFGDSAVVTQRNTTFTGRDEVRRFLEGAISRPRLVSMADSQVTGNHVSWVERSGPISSGTAQSSPGTSQMRVPGFGGAFGGSSSFAVNVDAVVQDGKIQSLEYTFGGQPTRTDTVLDGRQLPAVVGLGTVLLVLLGFFVIVWTGLGRAAPVASSLQGRLMQDLRGWAAARE